MPLIVTSATLQVCSFIPNVVNISTGELSLDDAQFETVPYIRFQKGLETNIVSSKVQFGQGQDLRLSEINAEKDRTVFVVNSDSLLGFLKECNLLPNQDSMEYPWVALDRIYYSNS